MSPYYLSNRYYADINYRPLHPFTLVTSNCLSSLVNTCTLYIVCLSFCLLTSSILVYLCQGWFDLMHVHSSEQVLNPESSNGDCKWRTLTRLIWVTVKGRNGLLLQKWLLNEVGSWQTIGGNIFKFGWRKALQPKMKEWTPWWQWPFAQTEENIGEVRRKYAARALFDPQGLRSAHHFTPN